MTENDDHEVEVAVAAHRIWLAPAIIEKILLHLDPRSILLIQRTSQTFRTTTKTTLSLQKKLFLHPITSPQDLTTLNLLTRSSTFVIPHHIPAIPLSATPASQFCLLNPLFPLTPGWGGPTRSSTDLRKRDPSIGVSLCTTLEMPRSLVARKRDLKKSLSGTPIVKSWEGMFLSQPPLLKAFPRGWDNPMVGGRVREVLGRCPRDKGGRMVVVVAGERVGGGKFLEVLRREEEEMREWMRGLQGLGGDGEGGGEEMDGGVIVLDGDAEEVNAGVLPDGTVEQVDGGVLGKGSAQTVSQRQEPGRLDADAAMQDMDTIMQDVDAAPELQTYTPMDFGSETEKDDSSSEDENSDLWNDDSVYNRPPYPSSFHNICTEQTTLLPPPIEHTSPHIPPQPIERTSPRPPTPISEARATEIEEVVQEILEELVEQVVLQVEEDEEESAFEKECKVLYEETMACLMESHEETMRMLAEGVVAGVEVGNEVGMEMEVEWDMELSMVWSRV